MTSSRWRGSVLGAMVVGAIFVVWAGPSEATWPPDPNAPCVNQSHPGQGDLMDPANWPDDPGYASDWNFWCWMDPDVADRIKNPEELQMGSGFHADRAWQRTIGDRRIVIAELDSGIRWREPDLVNKYYLNKGEIPAPDTGCGGDGTTYDVNNDGFFNVQDYTTDSGHDLPTHPCDSRILAFNGGQWDTNGNSFLDPEDLIVIFSDGNDDDANGYVDDICGWDFFDDDNDPLDDTDFGHGTGEAKDSCAEANNGRGSPGVCPECAVMPVRVGDSFVVDGNDFALGAIFAVDSGAAVIQEALGAISNSKVSRDALDYAWRNDVVTICSAADENSFHHNFPGTNNHCIYVHAIRYDSQNWRNATTFLNFNNCTNYGAQLALSVPGRSCSSEATGRTAGIAGLICSMALQADIPFPDGSPKSTDKFGARRLRSEEVRELLIETVDDIYDPTSADDPTRYPTKPGWDQRFGYGRVNAGNAVAAVDEGRIPPVADIQSPGWFDVIYPSKTPSLAIQGEVWFRRDMYDSVDWVLEWAPGIEPDDGDFQTIASGTETEPKTGLIADWDVTNVQVDNPAMPKPDHVVNRYMVTLRLRVTGHSADQHLDGTEGEYRKAVHVHEDPDLLDAFPLYLDASGESSPKLADLDGDGAREIVIADANGRVWAIQADGSLLPGWEDVWVNPIPHLDPANQLNHRSARAYEAGGVSPDVHSAVMATPAIADIDGNGSLEVVVASFDGYIYVFESDGSVYGNFPVELNRDLAEPTDEHHRFDSGVFASPVVTDLDGDGMLEIIVGAMDGHLYVWEPDGSMRPGFPVFLGLSDQTDFGRIMSTPTVGDIDGDGSPDLVMGVNQNMDNMGTVYAVHADGNDHAGGPFLTGFPIRMLSLPVLPVIGTGIPNAPAMADVDGDGLPEIGVAGIASPVSLYDGDGSKILSMDNRPFGPDSDSEDEPTQVLITNTTFADLDNNGVVDVIQGTAGLKAAESMASGGTRVDYDSHVSAWNTETGEFLPAWPRRVDDWQFFHDPTVADIDADGWPEVLTTSAGYYVHAWNAEGQEPAGWPKFTGQWAIAAPAVGDIDGDGLLEVVVNTRSGWLYAWNTQGTTDGRIDWASFHHDNGNTGNYMNPLDQGTKEIPDAGTSADASDATQPSGGGGGCNCRASGGNGGSMPLVLFAFILVGLLIRKRS